MRIAVFDSHSYDRAALNPANAACGHQLVFFEPRLTRASVELAAGYEAVSPFINCRLDAAVLERLKVLGVRLVALRGESRQFAALLSAAVDWLGTVDPHLHRFAALGELYTVPAHVVYATPTIAAWVAGRERPLLIVPPMLWPRCCSGGQLSTSPWPC